MYYIENEEANSLYDRLNLIRSNAGGLSNMDVIAMTLTVLVSAVVAIFREKKVDV